MSSQNIYIMKFGVVVSLIFEYSVSDYIISKHIERLFFIFAKLEDHLHIDNEKAEFEYMPLLHTLHGLSISFPKRPVPFSKYETNLSHSSSNASALGRQSPSESTIRLLFI